MSKCVHVCELHSHCSLDPWRGQALPSAAPPSRPAHPDTPHSPAGPAHTHTHTKQYFSKNAHHYCIRYKYLDIEVNSIFLGCQCSKWVIVRSSGSDNDSINRISCRVKPWQANIHAYFVYSSAAETG